MEHIVDCFRTISQIQGFFAPHFLLVFYLTAYSCGHSVPSEKRLLNSSPYASNPISADISFLFMVCTEYDFFVLYRMGDFVFPIPRVRKKMNTENIVHGCYKKI